MTSVFFTTYEIVTFRASKWVLPCVCVCIHVPVAQSLAITYYGNFYISSNAYCNCFFTSQALAAASKTVDCLKIVHSLHAYFLLVGDFDSKTSDQVDLTNKF